MYVRETKRRNADGSEVSYLALAHNVRDPRTGAPRAEIIHRFGRAEEVDRESLRRLVRSIGRFLDPADAVAATVSGEVRLLDCRPMGACWVADRLWQRFGIGEAIRSAVGGGRVDAEAVERTIFAMVANRLSVKPLSKLAGCGWVAQRAFVDGLAELSEDACYRAMDRLGGALGGVQERVFFEVASLLDLEVDLLFFDTSSTYWETDGLPAELADDDPGDGDDGEALLVERGQRKFGHSKDRRPDLPQVVLGMAVTRTGIPVRVWTFPGNSSDQTIIRTVKDDLRGWNLARVIWVLDRGFTSERNRRYLQRAGGHYVVGEKLRSDSPDAHAALARQGRYHTVHGGLRVKQVRIDDGTTRDRFVVCHNPERADRDRVIREQIIARLKAEIADTDQLSDRKRAERYGALQTKPAFKRLLRRTPTGKLRIDRAAVAREAKLDGKFLLRTSDETLTPADIALGYKALYEAERGWRDLKGTLDLRPVYHRREDRIQAHVQICWLALLLLRIAETETGDTWRNLRNELDRLHLVTLATNDGAVAQRTELTNRQRAILKALQLPEPPRFHDLTVAAAADTAAPTGPADAPDAA
jgi:Transposase DDE domain